MIHTEQLRWTGTPGEVGATPTLGSRADLVLVFGATDRLTSALSFDLRRAYPNAHVAGCSTAGEICGSKVSDDSVVVTALDFEDTAVCGASLRIDDVGGSREAGRALASKLDPHGLVHVLVLSDGLRVNGSELVQGLGEGLPAGVAVTGGLSGDGPRFQTTRVLLDGPPQEGAVVALGFYGERIRVGYGSLGGWDSFGPERLVTRSKGNVLYELDGESALDLYKRYLGEHAVGLPASGLLFPLALRTAQDDSGIVRTILSVSEADKSLTFAGDLPEGSYARLMKANFDRLVDGATGAAQRSHQALGSSSPEVAVLISCVGRKLVLQQRIEEEVEGVRDVLGGGTTLTGFYSYGEIAPFMQSTRCELHNQTMTITTFAEA